MNEYEKIMDSIIKLEILKFSCDINKNLLRQKVKSGLNFEEAKYELFKEFLAEDIKKFSIELDLLKNIEEYTKLKVIKELLKFIESKIGNQYKPKSGG